MNKTQKIIIWIAENTGRNTELEHLSKELSEEYEKATNGSHKYCKCENKAYSVNQFWKDWHCTYCLKPKTPKK